MMKYMDEGNIRLNDDVGFELAKPPTYEQLRTLRRYIEQQKGEVVVDLNISNVYDDKVESFEYPKGTSATKIINDIKKFYIDGTKPIIMFQNFVFQRKETT